MFGSAPFRVVFVAVFLPFRVVFVAVFLPFRVVFVAVFLPFFGQKITTKYDILYKIICQENA